MANLNLPPMSNCPYTSCYHIWLSYFFLAVPRYLILRNILEPNARKAAVRQKLSSLSLNFYRIAKKDLNVNKFFFVEIEFSGVFS